MMRPIEAAIAVAALSLSRLVRAEPLPAVAPEKVGLSSRRLARIGAALRAEIDRGKLLGAVVIVARRGRVAYFESFGLLDGAAGKPMPSDAIFRVYSMTKPFTSVAAMMLVEEGKLQLGDPVSRWLPAFGSMQVAVAGADPASGRSTTAMVPAEREITIHDLLRHSSGIVYAGHTANAAVRDAYAAAGLDSTAGTRRLAPGEFTERLAKAPLAHQPATVWEYGLSTDLLGRVVEAVTGGRLSGVLEERIFKPLQMRDTGFCVGEDKLGRVAQGFPVDPDSGERIELLDVAEPPGNDLGGAGAVSTASDYLRFCLMLLGGGRAGGKRLLSRTSLGLMASDHLGTRIQAFRSPGEVVMGTHGYTFGLGFAILQDSGLAGVPGSPGELSWGGVAGTCFWVDPKEELAAVLMTQAPGPSRLVRRRLVKQLVYQAIDD